MDIPTLKLWLLIAGVIITGSIEHITIPIMVSYFESLYFILIITSLEGLINFAILLLILTKGQFRWPQKKKLIMMAGCFNALMSMCFIYSANPERTPVVIQSIFLGLTIIPTVFFRKFILNKKITYDKILIPLSLFFLIVSVVIATIPLFFEHQATSYYWIIGYMIAIILLSLDNTIQEKYVTETNDNSVINKITLAFYTSMCQIITLILFFWVEFLFGYTDNPVGAFKNSTVVFFTDLKYTFLLQLFIYDCLILYVLSIYLNAISTNYNMILTNLTNQSVAIFFTIFPNLNHGLKYSLWVTISSLILNITSVVLWIMGEKNEEIETSDEDLPEIKQNLTDSDIIIHTNDPIYNGV
ncbi:hypothetical protein QKU48_gp1256 [Fadolivirus algeromassiliense]|jgi:hypothetical protein|uniref:Uncharacterized protein n=1 Tax=Fadolivirus FV1/VV64 TaxID=3070911 RepID=A0A7D3UWB8_9VIRU|nr:hypothetical protein QKU48_gp1256 [Fadolivirus algeromassiliense]QKF94714.1 hypothetical protein Fadolivirus_1_1256 [Fadolivirus FV1/VV64]